MKALLLLAGQSKRFWPLQEKSLFPVCGKTLLEMQVGNLQAAGIKEIILVGGRHNLEQAKKIRPDLQAIEQEDLSLGMRGALLSALPSGGNDPVMVVGGNDTVEPEAYKALMESAAKKGTDGALLAKRVMTYFPGGYLKLAGERIETIVEKPGAGKEPGDLVTIVAHVHNHPAALLAELMKNNPVRDDGYEQALAALFQTKTYHAVPYEGSWFPVKYPWHLLPLLQHALKKITMPAIHPTAVVHPTAVIDGNVILEEGARVFAHATIVGPCVIGRRSIVANNALVRGSSIGDDCVIGYSTEIKSSILASHVWTHMTYIGDSVIGSNVSFGGGSVTGNLRLDEQEVTSMIDEEKIPTGLMKLGCIIGDDCRLGIHTTLNPGIKIGKGSFVSSGVLVDRDIPEHSYVSMKAGEMTIRENRTSAPSPEARTKFKSGI
ncbi:MAG: NTP transferase domain-containing protein [Candidatus Peribacteraceae bacterium]|nr:NTP transferase domain-containing protein [Candidatus Peribacteraceae bacterium]MDD5741849.1 NTP transferase domain-containing protein [Candidatus Peribacteraceae bacterium]